MPDVPPGVVEAVLEILRSSPAPIRRRRLLEELEHRGHRISLAGLNRVVQRCTESGTTTETPDGIRSIPLSPAGVPPHRE